MAHSCHPTKCRAKQSTMVVPNQSERAISSKDNSQGEKRGLFRHQFKKTTFCRFHAAGKCRSGTSCAFAHGSSELSTPPDLTKTSLCTAWIEGKCSKTSENCKFAHGAVDVRMTPLFKVNFPVHSTCGGNGSVHPSMTVSGKGASSRKRSSNVPTPPQSPTLTASTVKLWDTTTGSSDLGMFSTSSDLGSHTQGNDSDLNDVYDSEYDKCLKDMDDLEGDIPQPRHDSQPTPWTQQEDLVDGIDVHNRIMALTRAHQQLGPRVSFAHHFMECTASFFISAPEMEREMLADLLNRAAPEFYKE